MHGAALKCTDGVCAEETKKEAHSTVENTMLSLRVGGEMIWDDDRYDDHLWGGKYGDKPTGTKQPFGTVCHPSRWPVVNPSGQWQEEQNV